MRKREWFTDHLLKAYNEDEPRDDRGRWEGGSGGSELPARTADTMSDAIAISSPSGSMSGRAQAAAQERLRQQLFGREGLKPPEPKQEKESANLRRNAKQLRDLAERGMKPRAYGKKAAEYEARAAELEAQGK